MYTRDTTIPTVLKSVELGHTLHTRICQTASGQPMPLSIPLWVHTTEKKRAYGSRAFSWQSAAAETRPISGHKDSKSPKSPTGWQAHIPHQTATGVLYPNPFPPVLFPRRGYPSSTHRLSFVILSLSHHFNPLASPRGLAVAHFRFPLCLPWRPNTRIRTAAW